MQGWFHDVHMSVPVYAYMYVNAKKNDFSAYGQDYSCCSGTEMAFEFPRVHNGLVFRVAHAETVRYCPTGTDYCQSIVQVIQLSAYKH